MKSLKNANMRGAVVVGLMALIVAGCAPPGQQENDTGAAPSTDETQTDSEDGMEAGEEVESDESPVQIGLMMPLSGPAAGAGEETREGFELYWDQHGYSAGGREIVVTVEDTASDPDRGLEVARRLVEEVGVDIAVGPLLGNVGLAVGDYMTTVDTPLFYAIPASDGFLRSQPDSMFRASATGAQLVHPLGKWAAENGYERILTICSDYAFGHEVCGGFVNTFTDYGGEIVDQLWAPLGTSDYAPFVSQIQGGDFDAVYSGVVLSDSIRFMTTWDEFGMTGTVPVLGALQAFDAWGGPPLGERLEGVISSGHYAEGRENDETQEFVAAFQEAYGHMPSSVAALGYLSAQWVAAALEELGGAIPSTEAFLDAVRSIEFEDSVLGPLSLDEHDNVIYDVYIREFVSTDGGMVNMIRDVVPGVGPTFEYEYDSYVNQPVYDRSYQGQDWPTDCDVYTVSQCPTGVESR